MSYLPTMLEEDFTEIKGFSQTRNTIVEIIQENNYKRPQYNEVRNNNTMINEDNTKGIEVEYYHPN